MTESLSDIVQDSARGDMFLFVGYFFSLLLLAIGSIIVARLLGPNGYGLFTLAFVVPSLILGFIDPGIGAALTRYRFLNLILYVSVFLAVYLTLLPIVGAVEESDIENFKLLFKNFMILQPIVNPILRYESTLLSVLKKQ